jgi:signal transduction histidine kinase
MITLVEMICEEHGGVLGERGRNSLELLRRRADRLIALVERVREYALLGRDLEWQTLELDGLVAEAIARLAPPATVRIEVARPLPSVRADRERLRMAFEHLLGNAIKFMDKPRGVIRVAAASLPDGWEVSIADNGPGIEAEFLGAVFKPGKTLAPQDVVEGSGMGLTLAKKAVELHGGRIWLESKPGEGTTVHFTLPVTAPAPALPLREAGGAPGGPGDGRGA